MLRKLGKKGSIEDVFFVGIWIFVIAIAFLVLGYIAPLIANEMQSSDIGTVTQASKAINKTTTMVNTAIDPVFMIIFVGLIIGIVITGFLITVHPVFIPIFIIFIAIAIVLGVIFSNVYEELSTTSALNETAARYTFSTAIMNNLPIIILVIGIVSMVIIFSKIFGGSQNV